MFKFNSSIYLFESIQFFYFICSLILWYPLSLLLDHAISDALMLDSWKKLYSSSQVSFSMLDFPSNYEPWVLRLVDFSKPYFLQQTILLFFFFQKLSYLLEIPSQPNHHREVSNAWIMKTLSIKRKEKFVLPSFNIMLILCHFAQWIFIWIRSIEKRWITHHKIDPLRFFYCSFQKIDFWFSYFNWILKSVNFDQFFSMINRFLVNLSRYEFPIKHFLSYQWVNQAGPGSNVNSNNIFALSF